MDNQEFIERQIKKCSQEIEFLKQFYEDFNNLDNEAKKKNIYIFSDAYTNVNNDFQRSLKQLRLKLCELRGE